MKQVMVRHRESGDRHYTYRPQDYPENEWEVLAGQVPPPPPAPDEKEKKRRHIRSTPRDVLFEELFDKVEALKARVEELERGTVKP